MKPEEVNFATLAPYFSNEEAAWKLLEEWRWPNGPVCPHCGVIDNAYFLKPKDGRRKTSSGAQSFRRLWKCAACRRKFSVLVGTVFEDSKIPVAKWLMAYHMMSASKNGVAAKELERVLAISYKSAWFMAHRIRYSLERADSSPLLTGSVEADETYVGGHAKFMHEKDRRRKFGESRGVTGKTAVVTLVSRDGEARSRVMEKVDGDNIASFLSENVDSSSVLMTDEAHHYWPSGQRFAAHHVVDHRMGQYARQRGKVTTNTAEGFFSQLKRSIDGTHHAVSRQHLGRYVAEFDYRYSNRKIKDGERTVKAVRQSAGRRLMFDKVR